MFEYRGAKELVGYHIGCQPEDITTTHRENNANYEELLKLLINISFKKKETRKINKHENSEIGQKKTSVPGDLK